MYAPHPVTALVEDIFATTRELDEAPLTPRQREKIANLRHHATELERRRAYADAFLRVGTTPYTERLARELGFTRKEESTHHGNDPTHARSGHPRRRRGPAHRRGV